MVHSGPWFLLVITRAAYTSLKSCGWLFSHKLRMAVFALNGLFYLKAVGSICNRIRGGVGVGVGGIQYIPAMGRRKYLTGTEMGGWRPHNTACIGHH